MNIAFDNRTLRSIENNDAPQLLSLIERNRARLTDYFPVTSNEITTLETSRNYIANKLELAEKREHFCFVVEDANPGLLGLFILKNFDWLVPKCEIAYFIDKDREGKGIMTGALSVLIKYCFEEMSMNKLFIMTATDNLPSRKVAEKNGFEVEGILRKNFRVPAGGLVDMVYYGLIRNEQ